ncbi:MAG: patatin-like phospholipase family protein [Chlorobiaceae bacterium]|nr:patatin-like phospholipase family protein [Chlorobiaceae bacterium]NTW74632.1 patatin-like phospholipase family protein [Chlorobiaceae bacterium]
METAFVDQSGSGASVGVAFGGGAVLGAAHIGVLRAMHELGVVAGCVSGTSIGSFIAALHAFGKSWQEIETLALDLDWKDLSGITISEYGLLSNRKFGVMVERLLGSCRIEEAPIPLAIVATDICSGLKVVLRKGDVATAVMASSSIPGIFRPVEYDGMLLVDGVLTENVPISPLREMGAGRIVCVDLMGRHTFSRPEHLATLLMNAFYSALRSISEIQMRDADLVITPDLTGYSLIDMSAVPAILAAGYAEALVRIKSWIEQDRAEEVFR